MHTGTHILTQKVEFGIFQILEYNCTSMELTSVPLDQPRLHANCKIPRIKAMLFCPDAQSEKFRIFFIGKICGFFGIMVLWISKPSEPRAISSLDIETIIQIYNLGTAYPPPRAVPKLCENIRIQTQTN